MVKRKALSKRTRFEVFKQHRFTCQYCGRTPPAVTLQIDHIVPVSKGGDNSRVNLLTACEDCNAGKSDVPLGEVYAPVTDGDVERGKERLAQLKAFNKLIKAERRELTSSVHAVETSLENANIAVAVHERRSIAVFLGRLGMDRVLEAADITGSKGKCWKYFCGVCWTMIKDGGEDG